MPVVDVRRSRIGPERSEGIQLSIVQDIARVGVALNKRGDLAIVLVEHNIDMTRAMAPRCCVMDEGRVIAELPPGDGARRQRLQRISIDLDESDVRSPLL